ncbi:mannose-1-phosphate guanylyltransferase/mannose-6-phosphate isomerase [Pelagibacterium xiamenense]|uniref:mannose-1-phosphate guanylyltransferase/mannose-6-phosphate isomerase n=1 Tax=Pelagibacterium xiamenense TaxID=2901140 RepID=UPI001E3EE6DE|nr:mannose-1-phosphate guanylyltransferase/mannose-6-phosphate isomerase [Pelagibacterium xiamenense]MCD7059666.1 mannose-1-phosphate guanylyltransferase/mannose-6-phosphate isomerase [Pelagibacterium xiamenense]
MTSPRPKIVPIVLAGGTGTRLWPMSRAARPKQFLSLISENSLFQDTLLRVADRAVYDPPIIVTNADYRFLVAEQAREIGIEPGAIVLEPEARNTAPAIAVAAQIANAGGNDPLLHVLPSDHAVVADPAYRKAVETGAAAAREGRLVTFGIAPDTPATGFGYIEAGDREDTGAHAVSRFVEKPDLQRAEAMIARGGYYWNSGMFMFSASAILEAAERLAPEVGDAAEKAVSGAAQDLDFLRLDADAFAKAPNISIDYAIFEKSDAVSVVPAAITWSDLGSWDAVWRASLRDEHGNVTRGRTTLIDSTEALVISDNGHVVVDGHSDIIVIASDDAVYVGRLSDAQRVGGAVERLKAQSETRALTQAHKTMYRPWGGYSSVLDGERFQVKRLFVKPGKKLSLQKHHHRAEHWVVVRGTGEIEVDGRIKTLRENESIYIPQGAMHRLSNPGKMLLEVIEVQTGSYLGEDDIVRIADEFGRA